MKSINVLVSLVCLVSFFGCDMVTKSDAPKKKSTQTVAKKSDSDQKDDEKKTTKSSGIKRGSLSGGSGGTKTVRVTFSESDSVDRLFELFKESTDFTPTLVVWCLDETPSAVNFVNPVIAEIKKQFSEFAKKENSNLLFAVYGFGETVKSLTEEPVGTADRLQAALAKYAKDSSDHENGLAAVAQAHKDYAEYKTGKGHQVIVVVVTDEVPSDVARLEESIKPLKQDRIPVYVVGKPAPFGRTTVSLAKMEESSMVFGPETADLERIHMDYWADSSGMEVIDSGFGPWAYERLCRETQGRFLAIRPSSGKSFASSFDRSWPLGARQFSPTEMARHLPDYDSYEEYLASLKENKAKEALHNAAQMERVRFNPPGIAEFTVTDQAKLAQEVLRSQQSIAAGSLPVKNLYETLKNGEADREKLEGARWQASYDLAMGRAAANYVRLDSANTMLADVKTGMKFQNPENNTWTIEPANEINSGSAHKRLAETAVKYLERVIEEHPDTPWAYIAERELQSPMGWKWTESKR